YFDSQCCGFGAGESGAPPEGAPAVNGQPASGGPPAIAIGRSAPLAMQGQKVMPLSLATPDLFRWTGQEVGKPHPPPHEAIHRRPSAGEFATPNPDFLTRTALDAQVSSDLIRKAAAMRPLVNYPGNALARQLALIAQMIRAGLKTRVYYASLGGFDTHAGQGGPQGSHANLLFQFSSALRAFRSEEHTSELQSR